MQVKHLGLLAIVIGALVAPTPLLAWGAKGHKIVALVADQLLQQDAPAVRSKVTAALTNDPDTLTAHDIASESTWADVFRASSTAARDATQQWHFVDIDLDHPDLAAACFGRPALQPGTPASKGLADDCVVDKISEFTKELGDPAVAPPEQLLALKFLIHFVGDIHQPLHAANHMQNGRSDFGGNCVAILEGHATVPIRLHGYWDDNLVVRAVGGNEVKAAAKVAAQIAQTPPDDVQKWLAASPDAWAQESFELAKTVSYNFPKQPVRTGFQFKDQHGNPDTRCGVVDVFQLDAGYDERAVPVVREQLAKAGVRLAAILRNSFQ